MSGLGVAARAGWLGLRGGGWWSLLRGLVLALGTWLLTLGLLGATLGHGRLEGSQARARASTPVLAAQPHQGQLRRILMSPGVVDGRPVTLVGLSGPAGSPLPPGMARLPRPGEVVMSEGLRQALAGTPERFGSVIQVLPSSVLETPTELRAYVGIARPPRDAMAVEAFGAPVPEPMTGVLYQPTEPELVGSILGSLGLAGLLVVWVGAGIAGEARRRILALLALSGASPVHRVAVAFGADGIPLGAGALAAVLTVVPLAMADQAVPTTATVLVASDARSVAWSWPVVTLVAVLLGLGACAFQGGGLRQRSRGRHVSLGGQVVVSCLAVVGMRVASTSLDGGALLLGYLGGVLALGLTLPAVVGLIAALLGKAAIAVARVRALPGTLLAGAQLVAHPRRTQRLVLPLVCGALMLTQVVLWAGVLSGQQAQAVESMRAASGRAAEVSVLSPTPQVLRLLRDPAPGAATVALTLDGSIIGPCRALRAFSLACRPGQQTISHTSGLAHALGVWMGEVTTVTPREVEARDLEAAGMVVVVNPASSLDVSALSRKALAESPSDLTVSGLGEHWVAASAPALTKARWLTLLGGTSLVGLVLGLGIAAAAQFAQQSRETVTTLRWSDRPAPRWALAAWRMTAPLLVATLLSAATAVWGAQLLHSRDSRFVLPMPVVEVLLAGGVGTALVLGALAAESLRRDGG